LSHWMAIHPTGLQSHLQHVASYNEFWEYHILYDCVSLYISGFGYPHQRTVGCSHRSQPGVLRRGKLECSIERCECSWIPKTCWTPEIQFWGLKSEIKLLSVSRLQWLRTFLFPHQHRKLSWFFPSDSSHIYSKSRTTWME
jgi:hypothetical protein